MSIFVKFAKKYFEEASKDLERAKRAMNLGDYPREVFYAQQCVEKSVKALLEARRRVVYNHGPEPVAHLLESYRDEWSEELEQVVAALEYLSEYYTRARYPFLLRGEVISPCELIDAAVASKGVEPAERALRVIGCFWGNVKLKYCG